MPRRVLACLLLAAPLAVAQTNSLAPADAALAQWNQLLPAIKAALPQQKDCVVDPAIADAAEFAPGFSVALVKVCAQGPTTPIIVMLLQDGHPVAAQFRSSTGGSLAPEFFRGDSPHKQDDVQLIVRSRSIVSTGHKTDEHNQSLGCGAAVFTWNNQTRTFDWNSRQTRKAFEHACAN